MPFSPSALLAILQRLQPAAASRNLCIAFSGGLDSTVLLCALATAAVRTHFSVRAIHIDHGLHGSSRSWNDHCAYIAMQLNVPYASERVTVAQRSDEGIEAAARTARYAAFKHLLRPGEILLTAQHADDQLETVLLALLRGAGVNGLAAMPACQSFGNGWHARPLLEFSRADLEAWGQAENLSWLSDPSNDNTRFSRNYLRHEVIPALRRRWPDAADCARRSAAHLGEAGELLEVLAQTDLEAAAAGDCLRVAVLVQLSPARRRNLLRYWLRRLGARAPSTQKLAGLEHDMLKAQADRMPHVHWGNFEVRRHRGLLYAGARLSEPGSLPQALQWDWREPLVLPAGLGILRMQSMQGEGLSAGKLPTHLEVSFRSGREKLRPAGATHRRDLKKLLQEADILPWWRDRIPLLKLGRSVLAVGDLWIAAEIAANADEQGVRIVWEDRPGIRAVMR